MSRFYRGIPARIAFLGMFETNHDEVKTPGYEALQKVRPTGIDGILRLFSSNEYGEISPELITITHMSCSCIFGGAVLGAVLHGRRAWMNFMENNQATAFVSHFDAQRKLRDNITLAMGKGGLKWGWKIGAFSTIFITTSTFVAAYRGGPGFFEYVAAGALTGSLFKMNLGLKGMISGSVVGTVFGAIAGALSVLILTITGITMQDIQNTQFQLRKIRDEYVRAARAENYSDESGALMKAAIIEEKNMREASGEGNANLISPLTVENKK